MDELQQAGHEIFRAVTRGYVSDLCRYRWAIFQAQCQPPPRHSLTRRAPIGVVYGVVEAIVPLRRAQQRLKTGDPSRRLELLALSNASRNEACEVFAFVTEQTVRRIG
jgi:hypothetical protein